MSAGRFERTRYEASYRTSTAHPITLQPETFASGATGAWAGNTVPSQLVNQPISATVSLKRRQNGLRPRMIRVRLRPGATPPAGYSQNATALLAVLSLTVWNSPATQESAVINYLGVEWVVVGRLDEFVN